MKDIILLNSNKKDLSQVASELKFKYQSALPFPHIVIDDFFDEVLMDAVLSEFPDLSVKDGVLKFDGYNEKKLVGVGESLFGDFTKRLCHFLNSQPFLEFLQELTGIKEQLLPDAYFVGGGHHEIKPGGFLKIHADFNKHFDSKLDRRINVLVYLNKDWTENYGGSFELWNKNMTKAEVKILPLFNRVAIFSTTSTSYHGNPDPVQCLPGNSRKSLAFYYYTNGRPEIENSNKEHSTIFVKREGVVNDVAKFTLSNGRLKNAIRICIPPIFLILFKRISKRR